MTATSLQVVSVNVGRRAPLGYRTDRYGQQRLVESAIRKTPILGRPTWQLGMYGLEGDEQVDTQVSTKGRRLHGGIYKAVYVYPINHLIHWRLELGRDIQAGGFGENVTVAGGLTEADIMIGDQWSWGDAILEVTGPRRPCYKLDMLWGEGTAEAMRTTGRSGWYCRVLQEGIVPILGGMQLIGRPYESVSVRDKFFAEVNRGPTAPKMPD